MPKNDTRPKLFFHAPAAAVYDSTRRVRWSLWRPRLKSGLFIGAMFLVGVGSFLGGMAYTERSSADDITAFAGQFDPTRNECLDPYADFMCDGPELRLYLYSKVDEVCFTERWR